MASLFVGEVDDFILPSQACINPVFADNTSNNLDKGGAKITLSIEDEVRDEDINMVDVQPALIHAKPSDNSNATKATVSLNDCLACSGCVTSAETVLLQQQSSDKFQEMTKSHKWDISVVSISSQSIAALSQHFEVQFIQMQEVLSKFFQLEFGVNQVVDTLLFSDFSLLEAAEEFIHRLQNTAAAPWAKPPLSHAESSSVTVYEDPSQAHLDPSSHNFIPMLVSECPGWVCYAEKTTPESLPYISTTKSAQQIAGALLKSIGSSQSGCDPRRILHATVMPCYDKKLEAARKDFFVQPEGQMEGYKEVDLVLTTGELLGLIEQKAVEMSERLEGGLEGYLNYLSSRPMPSDAHTAALLPMLSREDGQQPFAGFASNGGSGGYLEYIARASAKRLLGVEIAGPLQYCQGRNPDFQEVTIEVEGKPPLCFAKAYGFRNIQTVINKMKRGKSPYHLVEIMACPSGCLNGGGQVKVDNETPLQRKERLDQLGEHYHSTIAYRPPEDNSVVAEFYKESLGEMPFSELAQKILHTRYHAVPKLEALNPSVASW